jgi:putative ABC transport system permease protein
MDNGCTESGQSLEWGEGNTLIIIGLKSGILLVLFWVMLKNYFKIAWRHLVHNKFFSFINIFGLSAGLACCMLIALYLHYEMSYDSYHRNIADLYQVGTTFIVKGEKQQNIYRTPAPMAWALKKEFPEVVRSTRLGGIMDDKTLFSVTAPSGEVRSFLESKIALADGEFFKLFTYDFKEGSPAHALEEPYSVVVSEEIARKYFGDAPALGRTIHINSSSNGEFDYRVTGVFRPMPSPSHIDQEIFITFAGGNMEKYINRNPTNFAMNNMFATYIQLLPGTDPARFQAKLPAFMHKYADNDLKARGIEKAQFLIPVREIHLTDVVDSNVTPPASRTYLYILASIAVFTLLIACINFMNLSTARSSRRSSEVGVRKVLGAEKGELVRQFLGESLLMTFLAFVVAVTLSILLLPLFNRLSGKEIVLSWSADGGLFVGFLGMAVLTGLVAGSYPAFYLSSFNPVKVLKGKLGNSLAVASLRKGLVVFQFMISIVLIIATVVIVRQMSYLRHADLGFQKDQQLVIPLRSKAAQKIYYTLRSELQRNNKVISIAATSYYPGTANPADNALRRAGQTMSEAKVAKTNYVDADYMKTLGFTVVAGRAFSRDFLSDTSNSFILNESAVRAVGFATPQAAIGQKLYRSASDQTGVEIVGVVKDFHFEDLHVAVAPYAFALVPDSSGFENMIVHTRAGDVGQVIRAAEAIWHKQDATDPFEYTFLDEQFQRNYEADNRLAEIVGYFTVIAILISCLGLFGLAAFSAEQRTKEIGVRKVLGASVATIVRLLSVDFLKLILVSVVIASPIAWWIMNKWLQGFAYRQPITWTVFFYTTVIALVIGLCTIGFQAVRAAMANPVKSLKME